MPIGGVQNRLRRIPRLWHVATGVRLHRENRYDRFTHDVEQVTGQPPKTVEQYIGSHPELFG
ncbi:MAG TPA: hypothetical protein VN888_24510 [Mycobacterium sp.]|jgi:hypothetical protein|nr:hypothetical protein [Mycobacterium sp.]